LTDRKGITNILTTGKASISKNTCQTRGRSATRHWAHHTRLRRSPARRAAWFWYRRKDDKAKNVCAIKKSCFSWWHLCLRKSDPTGRSGSGKTLLPLCFLLSWKQTNKQRSKCLNGSTFSPKLKPRRWTNFPNQTHSVSGQKH